MNDDLQQLHQWADGLLQQLTPAARRQLARDIASHLRTGQQQRIAAQQNPDGSQFAPRLRQKAGRIRKRMAMFSKLRTARYLKTFADAGSASVYFIGRVQRIASVHQYGLRDRVRPGGPEVQYASRQLLGYSGQDQQKLQELVIHHLAR